MPASSMQSLILLRLSGDVSTKAEGTLERFSRKLAGNVEDALRSAGIGHRLERGRFRFMIEVDSPAALDVLLRVFGVQSISLVESRSWQSLDDVVGGAEVYFRDRVRGKRFAVRTRRSGRTERIPFRSQDVERALGRVLLPYAAKVDLSEPEVTAYVDVRPGTFYLYEQKLPARGGLPVGIEGRALALVSGGFDSGVAAWLMLKRGVELDYLFCNLGGEAHREGVLRVVKTLAEEWSHGTRPRLFEIDFAPVVLLLKECVAPRYWQIVLKRLMLRAAERVALKEGALGLVTGEALGQVSSQTLSNLAAISRGYTLPLFRPVLTFNKDEIIALSREIGTFVFSANMEEYCAILPRYPATHSETKDIEAQEIRLDPGRLEELLRAGPPVDIRSVELESRGPHREVETVPEGALLLDLRSKLAYQAWHAPEALYLDFFEALKTYRAFDPAPTYVLYCEVGQKSAHLAELMSVAGFRAMNVRGGVRTLLRQNVEADLLAP